MWVRILLPLLPLASTSLLLGCTDQPADDTDQPGACTIQRLRVNSIHLPRSGTEAASLGFDLDGDRVVDNQLGSLGAALAAVYPEWDAEMFLRDRLAERDVQWLALIERCDGERDWRARLARGADVDVDGRPEIVDDGAAASGEGSIAADGVGLVPVGFFADGGGFADDAAWESGLAFTLSARPTVDGDTTLTIGAAVELGDAALAPAAAFLTDQLARGSRFAMAIDTDDDKTISVIELRASPAVATLLGADIDTDDDGTPDRLSIGFAVTARPVIIE